MSHGSFGTPGRAQRHGIGALLCALALHAGAGAAAAAPQLRAGDLLVTDPNNHRVLHVDPATGDVRAFSPRAGSGPNLLSAPAGIAIDADTGPLVVDTATNKLIAINPTTGAQSEVRYRIPQGGIDDPLDIGSYPRGIAVSRAKIDEYDLGDAFVASYGAVYRVERDLVNTISTPLVTDATITSPDSLALDRASETGLLLANAGQLLAIDLSPVGLSVYYTPPSGFVTGVDWTLGLEIGLQVTCGGVDSGVYDYAGGGPSFSPRAAGSPWFGCPGAITVDPATFETYAVDAGASPEQIVAVASTGGTRRLVATLPATEPQTIPFDLDVSPVTFAPEPGAQALGLLAIALLAGIRRAITPP